MNPELRQEMLVTAEELLRKGVSRRELFVQLNKRHGAALTAAEVHRIREKVAKEQEEKKDEKPLLSIPPPPIDFSQQFKFFTEDEKLEILVFAEEHGNAEATKKYGVADGMLVEWQRAATPKPPPPPKLEDLVPLPAPEPEPELEPENQDEEIEVPKKKPKERKARTTVTAAIERKILQLVRKGWSHRDVGLEVGVAASTVSRVVSSRPSKHSAPEPAPRVQEPEIHMPSIPALKEVSMTRVTSDNPDEMSRLRQENEFLRRAVGEQATEIMMLKFKLQQLGVKV